MQTALVKIGDEVTNQQLLMSLNKKRLQIELQLAIAKADAAKANVAAANLDVELAGIQLKREQSLKNTPAHSKALYDDLKINLANSNAVAASLLAEYSQALAEQALAELNLKRAEIRAPFAGIITEKFIEVGTYVKAGDPVFRLLNQQKLEIEIQLPRAQLNALMPNQSYKIEPNIGAPYTATVRAVVLEENNISHTLKVRLEPHLNSKVQKLIPNESVTLAMPINKAIEVLSIHKDGLLKKTDGFYVFIAENNTAILKPITIGSAIGQRVEIKSGLQLGDKVIIRGNERLSPNQPIRFKPIAP